MDFHYIGQSIKSVFVRIFKYIKIAAVVLFLIFEEILWDRIGKPAYEKVQGLKIMDRFKGWIRNVKHRYALLGIFIIPFVAMEAAAISSTIAFGTGAIITGIGLYVIKMLMTVPVVIIFKAGKEQLVSFWVIRYSYGVILNFKRSGTYRSVIKYLQEVKVSLNQFKANYLDGDGSFKEEMKTMYYSIKALKEK